MTLPGEEQVPAAAVPRPGRVFDAVGGGLYAAVAALGLGAVFTGLGTATWLSIAAFALTLAVVHLTTNRARTPATPAAPTPWRRSDGRDLGVLLSAVGVTALLARAAGDLGESTAGFLAWLLGLVALALVRLGRVGVDQLLARGRAETCLELLEDELRLIESEASRAGGWSTELRPQQHLVRQARDLLSQELRLLEARQVPVADVERARAQGVEVLRRMPPRAGREPGVSGPAPR
ncbi:hypothetical protein GC722_08175 [Auraticoccus sp. F435]|uniref:Uncharacterized protein n=1 Tax=Auraticoccus cholistanensis TaxID=2656650 RepID=A0A6A9UTL5_9ACTN|nr:hypothetical protein [Auraticoccus cholistanensis]MVA75998.1 hypothetical protein [Auraticoccus cholistanensis]